MKWFGPTWHAPVCDVTEQIQTPVGEECMACGRPIRDMDQGLAIPYVAEGHLVDYEAPWHLNCFLHNIGARGKPLFSETESRRNKS